MKLPAGFQYSTVYAGIRKTEKDDLALIHSLAPAAAAGVFTTNLVKAAPVLVCQEYLKRSRGYAQAILVNAGNANCATRTGMAVARSSSEALAGLLGLDTRLVLPCSTGVIGVELPIRKISQNLQRLVAGLAENRFLDVAKAIMTTDTQHKAAVMAGSGWSVAGMTKGAGMIQPNMATTLCYVMTDAAIGPDEVRQALREAVEVSYHRLTIDGDTSTNDTVLLLANGASGVRPKAQEFQGALTRVLQSLAIQIAMDGEGANKLIEIVVAGAKTNDDAARIGRAIANSPLVKTAVAGNDANWGRVLCAAGYAGVPFDPSKTSIWLQDVLVCKEGLAARFSESSLQRKMNTKECRIRFEIAGRGKGTATFWTCDLTEGYIQVNASYRT